MFLFGDFDVRRRDGDVRLSVGNILLLLEEENASDILCEGCFGNAL